MTADAEQVAAAVAAFEEGTAASVGFHAVAGGNPGVGAAVSLPSVAGPGGPVRGRGFDLPEVESVPRLGDRP